MVTLDTKVTIAFTERQSTEAIVTGRGLHVKFELWDYARIPAWLPALSGSSKYRTDLLEC